MKPSTATNIALVLALLAWPILYAAFLHSFGPDGSTLPEAEMKSYGYVTLSLLLVGMLLICSSLFLAGYGFTAARVRAVLSTAIAVMPFAIVLLSAWYPYAL